MKQGMKQGMKHEARHETRLTLTLTLNISLVNAHQLTLTLKHTAWPEVRHET